MPAKKTKEKEEPLKEKGKTPKEKKPVESKEEIVKAPQPKFKVEEKEASASEEKPAVSKEDNPEEKLGSQPRKITSFSQLDTKTPPSAESKSSENPSLPDKENKPEKASVPESGVEDKKAETEPEKHKPNTQSGKKKEVSSDEIKDWLNEVRPEKKEEKKKKGSFVKVIVWTVVVLLVLGALVGGVIYYKSSFSQENQEETQPESEEMSEPTSTPEPTAAPEVSLDDYTIKVQNGSGIAGEAGNVADLLSDAGFANPDTGNAESYDFTTTVVETKASVPNSVYNSIKEALSDQYIVEKSEQTLDDSSSYDIVITVGSKKE
jgi:hypothetical protein